MKTARTVGAILLMLGLCGQAPAQNGPVRFQATVVVDEQHDVVPVCYGDYFVEVSLDEVLQDDEGLLGGVTSVEVCYAVELGLKAGDRVEVYGMYYSGTGACPKQYCRRVIAVDDPYAVTLLPGRNLYVLTREGIMTVTTTGHQRLLIDAHHDSYALEVRDGTLYATTQTRGGDIVAYDLEGNYHKTIRTPPQADDYLTFVALPRERFALLDNINDKVFFCDDAGTLLATTNLRPVRDGEAQSVKGVVVGNRLIVSEDWDDQILRINLSTYEASVFKDLSALDRSPGAITYANGKYYVCTSRAVYAFTETTGALKVANIPEYNVTGICVIEDVAYVTVNFGGQVYAADLTRGTVDEVTSGLNYPMDIACAVQTGCFELCMPITSLIVPDRDAACWTFLEPWYLSLPPQPTWAPEDAVVTKLQYKIVVEGPGMRCSDYEISIDNDPCDTDGGLLVYDNLGGLTDGGHDDDLGSDRDIELNWRETDGFDGQTVHQDWTVCVSDTVWGNAGYASELCLRICWEIADDELTCCGFRQGDRVTLLTDNPRGAAGLVSGMEGTVICCDLDDPSLPVFVSWDDWTNGRNTDSFCDTSPLDYPEDSGWWVACEDIEAVGDGGDGGNGGCLADLNGYIPLFWSFTPETVDICSSSERLDISYGVKNSGCDDSGDFYVCFYASTNDRISSSDHLLYRVPHNSMAPGQSGTWITWVHLNPGELDPGTYYVGGIIDCENDVAESDESNNTVVIENQRLTVAPCMGP